MNENNTVNAGTEVLNTEPTTKPEVAPAKVVLTALQVELQMAEKLIKLKYPHLEIIDGSLVQEAAHPVYGNKRRVKVKCPICGAVVERATSDLFTFKACPACLKGVRKANKLGKKVALLQALAAATANTDADAGSDSDEAGDDANTQS